MIANCLNNKDVSCLEKAWKLYTVTVASFCITDDLESEMRHTFRVPNEVECRLWHGFTRFSNQRQTLKDEGLLGEEVGDPMEIITFVNH